MAVNGRATTHEMNVALHSPGNTNWSIDEKNILAGCRSLVPQKNKAAGSHLLLMIKWIF